MKILAMHLLAYGPFSDLDLDLSVGNQGLHFIYGPNEAGKSSALRALRHMLFGIPQRCTDDFLHPYGKMRIGAKICSQDGKTLSFLRRKGRGNTLRAMDDATVIDEPELERFFKGVDLDQFTSLFGIDYTELTTGGKAIVEGGGNLGKLLFSAGSGIADLGRIERELNDKSDALFKRSAQKPAINAALLEIDARKKALREAQLPSRKFEEHDQVLREARQRLEGVEAALLEHHGQLHQLERIEAALPIIARRRELLAEFEEVANVVALPLDFSKKRIKLVTSLKIAAAAHEQSLQRIESLNEQITSLNVPEELLAVAKEIETFYREVGSLQKADKDRLQLKTRRSALMAEAGEIIKKLRPGLALDAAETLRIQKADMVRIHELGTAYERLDSRRKSIREEKMRLESLFAANQKQKSGIAQPRDTKALKDAAAQAEEHAMYESRCREERARIAAASETLTANIAGLGLWSGTAAQLERLAVPSTESVSIFETRFDALQRDLDTLNEKRRQHIEQRREIDAQIQALQAERPIPNQADLDDARNKRGQGWRLLRMRLENSAVDDAAIETFAASFPQSASLIEAYESAVQAADHIADRLRQEADAVATLSKLRADRARIETQDGQVAKGLDAAAHAMASVVKEWQALWQPAGITPRSAKEMRAWLQKQGQLAQKAAELRERRAGLDHLAEAVARHHGIILRCLGTLAEKDSAASGSLQAAIKQSRRIIENEDAKQAALERHLTEEKHWREELEMNHAKAGQAEEELAHWKTQWKAAMQLIGLDENAMPREAGAVIEENKTLFDTLKEARILEQRIEGIGRDEADFADKIGRLTRQAAPDLCRLPAQEAAMTLNRQLTQARSAHSRRQSLAEEVAQEELRRSKNAEKITEIKSHLDMLCGQAGCESHEDLPLAEERSERRCRIEAEMAVAEQELRKLSAGAGIAEFTAQALSVDPDSIAGKSLFLKETISGLDQKKGELHQTIGKERNELSKMDGSGHAADLAEQIQLLLGRLQNDVERYSRLKIAAVVLNQAIERFRDKNQGPILTHAGRIFAELTCGSFAGIRADYDEKGTPVLVGVRPDDGGVVGVAGMSDGTADQLYLSLRLAGLLDYLERNEPMPFIVDDILIQFDDQRAVAALKALGELSQKTQVIFFSHHRHLLTLAEKTLDKETLVPHFL